MSRGGEELGRTDRSAGEAGGAPGPATTGGVDDLGAGAVNIDAVAPSNGHGAAGRDAAATGGRGGEPRPDREIDRALVERVRAGDRRAFAELFQRHHERAFAVAYGVLKNAEDARDVVQEAFVKVHRHLATFQGDSSFYTWLYRILMNLSIDQLRRKKTARGVEYVEGAVREEDAIDDTILPRLAISNPGRTAVRRELMARVEAALDTRPPHHRQVIVLREIEGMSYEEIAEATDVPKGTVMSRLHHARRKMQDALAGVVEAGDLEVEE